MGPLDHSMARSSLVPIAQPDVPGFWLVGAVRVGLCEDGSLSWLQMLQSLYGQTPPVWAEGNNNEFSSAVKQVKLLTCKMWSVTHNLPANPVVGVVKGVSFSLKQFREQSPQIFIVWLFKEVQPPHISQVGGHLLCITQNQQECSHLSWG